MSTRFARAVLASFLVLSQFGCEPDLPPMIATSDVTYANPGWTHRDRQIYYYTPQGTELHSLRYRWFTNLELPFSDRRIADPELLAGFGFITDPDANELANPGGLPVGFAFHADPEGEDPYLDITCAACHTGELHYRGKALRIDGGQAMHALASTQPGQFAPTLVLSMLNTYLDPFEFDQFARRVLGVEYPKEKRRLRDELGHSAQKFIREAWHGRNLYPTEDGYGRIDALGHIANAVFGDGLDRRNYREANAPVNYPHVWDIWKFDWVQWGGSVAQPMGRNVGEALGVKAPLDLVGEYGSTLPDEDRFDSSVLVRELHCIESTLWQLEPPVWREDVLPEIDLEQAKAGAELFANNCQRCHGPHKYPASRQPTPGKPLEWRMIMVSTGELGTDPRSASNFTDNRYDATTVDPSLPRLADVSSGDALDIVTAGVIGKQYDELELSEEQRWWLDGFGRKTEVQVIQKYKARPLHGIWATPPFLHNGSVPSLYQLLLPEEERDETFWVGTREFDPVEVGYRTNSPIENGFLYDTRIPGNANTGHQFRDDGGAGVIGRGLTVGERYALVEFLKILGNTDPRYDALWRTKADLRPNEIPAPKLPKHFAPHGPGLPAPQCESIGTGLALQGPSSLSLKELPVKPKRRSKRRSTYR